MVTTGQRALPRRLEGIGFEFRHRDLEPALHDVLNRR
jgi:NAD dependent epimerase/dehydratase family enzyme